MIRRTFAALRSLLSDGRPDDLCALIDATAEPEPRFEDTPLYHAVVSEMAEALADLRAAAFGDEDFAEWSRELMFEGES